MYTRHIPTIALLILAAGLGWVGPATAAKDDGHYIGPIGVFGNTDGTRIVITKVEPGSPAEGKLLPNDVITGAFGTAFTGDPRQQIATAIDRAETEAGGGRLVLMLDGEPVQEAALPAVGGLEKGGADLALDAAAEGGKRVTLQLRVLGSYSATAPYDCPKSDAIVRGAVEQMIADGSYADGQLAIGWLGLMATGEPAHLDIVRRELPKQDWLRPDTEKIEQLLAGEGDMGMVGWYWGYQCVTLAEYHLLTGDESVLPALETYATALARGQDAGGMWGHRMATTKRNGRLPGYAQMNQTSLTCFMGMIMARRAGISNPALDAGIARTYAYYRSFIGRGAFNYGVHGPKTSEFNNNGTSGSAAVDMALLGDRDGAAFFSQLSATAWDRLETGHASYYFNPHWTPIGAHVAGPDVTRLFFAKSRWLHTLWRRWDGSFTFDGDHMRAGNSTGTHLLAYCLPRRALLITGRDADESVWLDADAAETAVMLSQIDYAALTDDALLAYFDHPIPQVRRRAVHAARDRADTLAPRIAAWLADGTPLQRRSAVAYFGYGCPAELALPQLPALGAILRDSSADRELRADAAGAIAQLGQPAYVYYHDMLQLVADPEQDDPYNDTDWAVGNALNTLCASPHTAGLVTEPPLFYAAARTLADNKRQQAREQGMRMLADMPLTDFPRIGDAVLHIARDKDPTYHSYHQPNGAILNAIKVLAHLRIDAGMDLGIAILDEPSGKFGFKRRAVMAIPPLYGGHAGPYLDKLATYKALKSQTESPWMDEMRKMVADDPNPAPLITVDQALKIKAE